jgi:hypothetical protein
VPSPYGGNSVSPVWLYEDHCTLASAPRSLVATATTDGTVELAWSAPASDGGSQVTRYHVASEPPCEACTGITTNATWTIVSGLAVGSRYRFTVAAENGLGTGPSSTPSAPVLVSVVQGYWQAAADGRVFSVGAATASGDLGTGTEPVVGVAGSLDGKGCLVATVDGEVRVLGDMGFYGDLPSLHVIASDIVGVAPTADRRGYWLVGRDGGVFTFGDAKYHGSASGLTASDIVGIAATRDDGGYWLVAKDGGVFAFGDAKYRGSLPGIGVHVSDVRAMMAAPDGAGYLLVGADGGVFAFGSGTHYLGSLPGRSRRVDDIVGATPTFGELGYWLAGADGAVYAFGDARNFAPVPGASAILPIAAVAAT